MLIIVLFIFNFFTINCQNINISNSPLKKNNQNIKKNITKIIKWCIYLILLNDNIVKNKTIYSKMREENKTKNENFEEKIKDLENFLHENVN